MSDLSINTRQSYTLNGIERNAPIGWQDNTITANYGENNVQPTLDISEITFPLEARDTIKEWFDSGIGGGVGPFEGMPLGLKLYNNKSVTENFKSIIDFRSNYQELLEDGTITTAIMKDEGLDNFFNKIGGLTYGYLESIGVVGASDYVDVDYVAQKKFNLVEILVSGIVLYLMVKELAEAVRRTADAIANVSSKAAIGPFGSVGAVIYSIAIVLINAIYTAILLLTIIELAKTLFNTLIPPKRKHKAIKFKRALEVVCNHLGYNLVAPMVEMEFLHYLPSNPRLDEQTILGIISITKGTPTGIPNTLDYGYNCEDMFMLAKNIFFADMAIVGDEVHLRPSNDPYWIQQSNYELPDVLIEKKEYNLGSLNSTFLGSFSVDLNDEYTIDNYRGTSYEVKTDPIAVNNQKAVLIKGLDEVSFNVALGNVKTKLNALETVLKALGSVIDGITGVFGGGTNFAGKVKSKIGILKQSDNWHAVPKMLYIKGGKIPNNHRDLFSAKILYEKYHSDKSFVLNNYFAQKTLYNGVTIPFGFEDYKKLTVNPYFKFNSKTAKIIKFTWTVGQDTALVDFWVREPYTFNLKETYIEQD